jgi:hypothetical protein
VQRDQKGLVSYNIVWGAKPYVAVDVKKKRGETKAFPQGRSLP